MLSGKSSHQNGAVPFGSKITLFAGQTEQNTKVVPSRTYWLHLILRCNSDSENCTTNNFRFIQTLKGQV